MTLRYIFIDMNSYFASVEQQESPALRGKPVGVVPVLAGSTCCIAASYEAKAFGVKTGTHVSDARVLCPGIRLALARPKLYVEYHHRIIDAVEKCIHVEEVCSIDEMYGKLYLNERDPETALGIARNIKDAIRRECGEFVRCSIGIGPNVWLAKVATDLEKPDGLVVVDEHDVKERLCSALELEDLPGIARGMSARLKRRGVTTVRELYELSARDLSYVWGSKLYGVEWWQKLRGYDVYARETKRRTVSHSHVLAPEFRNMRDAYGVAIRMLHKAAFRLRKIGYWTERLTCVVRYSWMEDSLVCEKEPGYGCSEFGRPSAMADGRYGSQNRSGRVGREIRLGPTRDTITLTRALERMWKTFPQGQPLKVAVVLTHLLPNEAVSLKLFAEDQRLVTLADTMDVINRKYEPHTVYLAAMHGYNRAAPERISFTQIPALESFTEKT